MVEIQRPVEEYAITLAVTKFNVNVALRDDQFSLQQPSGAQVINVDEKNASVGNQPSAAVRHN